MQWSINTTCNNLHFENYPELLFLFYAVPSKLMVNWENDVPFYHSGKEGVYILASELLQIPAAVSLVNLKPYWIKENKEDAIWFDPESDSSWNIGAMKDVGTSTYNITSTDKTSMPFEVINWEYQKGRNWIPTTDIKVQGKIFQMNLNQSKL